MIQLFTKNVLFLGGFFIEAGAYDFEYESTSLYFELLHDWTVFFYRYLIIFLFVYIIQLSIYLYLFLPINHSIFTYLSFYMSIVISFYMSKDLSFYMSKDLTFYMSKDLSFYVSKDLSFYMSADLSFYMCIVQSMDNGYIFPSCLSIYLSVNICILYMLIAH